MTDCPIHGSSQMLQLPSGSWICKLCDNERLEALRSEEAARKKRQDDAIAAQIAENKKREIARRIEKIKIPPRFKGASFNNYSLAHGASARVLDACKKYADEFTPNSGAGLILFGKVGTGKTHLACAIGNKIAASTDAVTVYTSVLSMSAIVRATFNDANASEAAAISNFVFPDLLILDDVGVQSGSQFEANLINTIIAQRYDNLKSTVITTNLDQAQLTAALGERATSRLAHNTTLLRCDWADYRALE